MHSIHHIGLCDTIIINGGHALKFHLIPYHKQKYIFFYGKYIKIFCLKLNIWQHCYFLLDRCSFIICNLWWIFTDFYSELPWYYTFVCFNIEAAVRNSPFCHISGCCTFFWTQLNKKTWIISWIKILCLFKKIKSRYSSAVQCSNMTFVKLCRTGEIQCEKTLQPWPIILVHSYST